MIVSGVTRVPCIKLWESYLSALHLLVSMDNVDRRCSYSEKITLNIAVGSLACWSDVRDCRAGLAHQPLQIR